MGGGGGTKTFHPLKGGGQFYPGGGGGGGGVGAKSFRPAIFPFCSPPSPKLMTSP